MPNVKIQIYNEEKNKYYTILVMQNGNFFLQNEEGEGMGMDGELLFPLLDKFFKEHF